MNTYSEIQKELCILQKELRFVKQIRKEAEEKADQIKQEVEKLTVKSAEVDTLSNNKKKTTASSSKQEREQLEAIKGKERVVLLWKLEDVSAEILDAQMEIKLNTEVKNYDLECYNEGQNDYKVHSEFIEERLEDYRMLFSEQIASREVEIQRLQKEISSRNKDMYRTYVTQSGQYEIQRIQEEIQKEKEARDEVKHSIHDLTKKRRDLISNIIIRTASLSDNGEGKDLVRKELDKLKNAQNGNHGEQHQYTDDKEERTTEPEKTNDCLKKELKEQKEVLESLEDDVGQLEDSRLRLYVNTEATRSRTEREIADNDDKIEQLKSSHREQLNDKDAVIERLKKELASLKQ